jgi:hypothetical protein
MLFTSVVTRSRAMKNAMCHWELMVGDTEKTKAFYRRVFDWKFDEATFPGYTAIDTGREPRGGLMLKPEQAPAPALNVYFTVDDVQRTLHDVVEAGGKVVVPKTQIPTVGAFAMFTDPDGIAVGILEPKMLR